jgi:hypothetical protein
MKIKRLIVLSAVFAALLLVILAYKQLTKPRIVHLTPYAKLDRESLDKIVITKKDYRFVFQKDEEKWDIAEPILFMADQKLIKDILDNVLGLKIMETVSSQKDKQADFQVDEATNGIHVEIYEKDKKAPPVSFILGKSAYDYMLFYFRYPGSDEIKVCKGPTRGMLEKTLKEWREKAILFLQKDKIDQVKFSRAGKTVMLNNKDGKWFIGSPEEGFETDAAQVNPVLDALVALKADDFVETEKIKNLKEFNLVKPSYSIAVKSGDLVQTVLFGKKITNFRYYMKLDNRDTVFLVNTYRTDPLEMDKIEKLTRKQPEPQKK